MEPVCSLIKQKVQVIFRQYLQSSRLQDPKEVEYFSIIHPLQRQGSQLGQQYYKEPRVN